MAEEEEFLGRACDNPKVIRARGRYAPALEDPVGIDPTEGMCTSVHCNFEDVEAWRVATNRFMERLKDVTDQLQKKVAEEYGSVEEAPEEVQELITTSRTKTKLWKESSDQYGPQRIRDYVFEYGEYIVGYWFIHWKTKPIVEEIIAEFRDAACLFDEINDTYEELGGKAVTVPGTGKKPTPKKTGLQPLAAAALFGAAVFFGYQTTKKKKRPPVI